MRNYFSKKRDQGIVVAIALIAIMVMTFFLITGAATTTSAVRVSGNYSKTVDVFNNAEAGLARARPLLENQDFSDLLATYEDTYLVFPTDFNGGTYEVTLENDENDTGGATTDTNSIIKLVSVGKNSQGGQVQIETYLQLIGGEGTDIEAPPNPSSCTVPPCDSAGLFCGTDSDVRRQGSAVIDGDDHAIPGCDAVGCGDPPTEADLIAAASCSGNGCNAAATTSGNANIIAEGSLACSGCSGINDANVGTASGCAEWQAFYDQWASISPSAPNVVLLNQATYSDLYYPCTDPKIFLVNSSLSQIKLTGHSYLCGTFIIASETNIKSTGTMSLVGLYLMMGDYSNLTFAVTTGTSNVSGKFIFKSTTADSQKELTAKGNTDIFFSSAGVGYGMEAINNSGEGGGASGSGMLITAAWEETY